MHAKYVQLYKNENKMLLSAPLPESLTHGIPAERPRPQTSPNRPSAPSHPTDRDQHQMHSSTHTAVTPLPETLTNRVPAERPKPQTSPNRPSASSRRTDRDRELEENLQQRMVYDMYNHAAIRIQAAFRGFWARDSLDVDHFCASLIQRCVRRFLHVKKYSRGHYHVFPYAVRIQSMWRGVLARQNLHRSIGAAILIQAYTRGFIGRLLSREKKINTQRRIESVKSEKPAIPKGTGDSSWQKGLANGLWQARIIRMSDNEERLPSALNSRPHTADFSKSFSEEQSRSLSFAHLKDQQTSSSATQEQFPSFHRPEAKKLSARYHPPDTFTPVTLSRVATIKVSAAIKIQTRYRTYACERKLIRSLVDILIAQTVIRRWLARRRAARLRTLRDRCRIILENGDSKLSDCQSTTAPRLVSRSEFFQNRILQPRGHVSHPHFNSTSDSGPSFGEDEFRQPGKDRRATNNKTTKYLGKSSSDEDEQNQTYGYHNVVNGSTSSSFRRTKSPGGGMSDSQVPTQLPQWANMTLRSTKSKATLHETSTDRLENRTPPQLTGSSESESRVYSIPSYDSETRSTTSATHPAANLGRRQVVVTPPVLLKKNTDRKVSQR